MLRPTMSLLLPAPSGNSFDREVIKSRAVAFEPPATTTILAVISWTWSSSSTYRTPVSLPASSTTSSVTMARMRSSQFPLARATGMTVFCEPFFASMGHWKPTHACWWMQAGRPLYGTELRRNGAWNGWSPIFFPTSHTS